MPTSASADPSPPVRLRRSDERGYEAHIRSGEIQLISAGSDGMIHAEENVHDEVEHN